MFGERIRFKEAQMITSENKARIYAKMTDSGTSGFERAFGERFPKLQLSPKFQIQKSGRFFTIGSCFARNIEFFLARQGIDCITSRCVIPGELYEQSGLGARNGALNAYTPHSMLDLIRLTGRSNSADAGALRLGDDEWADMMVSGIKFLSGEELGFVRRKILDTYSELKNADTVIITLGYTESWYDKVDEIFVNRSPGASIRTARHGERYDFMNASVQGVIAALHSIIQEIQTQTNGRAKVILTVSPVPLHGTFTGVDVIMANQYSKSTLLTSAVSVAAEYDWVDYYPSYEMVTLSERSWAWSGDGVHVNPEVVGCVMNQFAEAYIK